MRHGEVSGIEGPKRYIGTTDVPMSEEGAENVARTARILAGGAGEAPEARVLVTSPLIRCVSTAEILEEAIPFKALRSEELLKEIDLGEWEMLEMEAVRNEEPEMFRERGSRIETYRTPGGETFLEAGERFAEAFTKWTQAAAADGIRELYLITHRGAALSGIAKLRGEPCKEMLKRPFPYAGVIVTDENCRIREAVFPGRPEAEREWRRMEEKK